MFCPSCFIEMKDSRPIEEPGYVYSFTTVSRNRSGKLGSWPVTIALIKFANIQGGIIHRLEVDDTAKISFGMKVSPILKPPTERTGAITDIIAFKPE